MILRKYCRRLISASISDRILIRLSRVTSSGEFIHEIDGLRFFAITAVLLFHINGYFLERSQINLTFSAFENIFCLILKQGFIGVQLFFAISGFILSLPFASRFLQNQPLPSLNRYYLRRLTRLEPPYFINLISAFVLLLVVKHEQVGNLLPSLFASLFYSHNILFNEKSFINIVAWSLEIEVQFYILAPFLCRLYLISNILIRRLSFVLISSLCMWLNQRVQSLGFTHWSLLAYIQFFMVGFFLTDLYLVSWKQRPIYKPLWDLWTTFAGIGIIIATYTRWSIPFVVPPLILVAYVGAFRGPLWNAIVRNRWLVTIGGMCYTIYLWHAFIYSLIARNTIKFHFTEKYVCNILVQVALNSIFIIVASSFLFLFFEKPFMYKDWPIKWRKKIISGISKFIPS